MHTSEGHSVPRDSADYYRRRNRNRKRADRRRRHNARIPCVKCNVVLDSFSLRRGSSICSSCSNPRNISPSRRGVSLRNRSSTSPDRGVTRDKRAFAASISNGTDKKSNSNQNNSSVDDDGVTEENRVDHTVDLGTVTIRDDPKAILEHGMKKLSTCTATATNNVLSKRQIQDAGLPQQPQLVDSPCRPFATFSIFPSVNIVNRLHFKNSSSSPHTEPDRNKDCLTNENLNNFLAPNSSLFVARETNQHGQTNVSRDDSSSSSSAVRKSSHDTNGNMNPNGLILQEAADNLQTHVNKKESLVHDGDNNSIPAIAIDPTVNSLANKCQDICSHLNSSSSPDAAEEDNRSSPVKSEDCPINDNCSQQVLPNEMTETRPTNRSEDNVGPPIPSTPRSSEKVVLSKKETVDTSKCLPKTELHCETCQSPLENDLGQATVTLCQSCSLVDDVPRTATPESSTPSSIDGAPQNNGESNGRGRSDSLSSLDLPPPESDDLDNEELTRANFSAWLSSTCRMAIRDNIRVSSNRFATAPTSSPTTIRLCRICDNGTFADGYLRIELSLCELCRLESPPRKRYIGDSTRPSTVNHVLDDEYLSKLVKRHLLNASLHDDESFTHARRPKRRRRL